MAFYFKNTTEDNISYKIIDHCHLTGKCRGPAHNKCHTSVRQKQSSFVPFLFHYFSNYDCHPFFKNQLIERMIN